MKYRDLQIQTQREFPNNARTEGFGWLVRAGYLTREKELTPLGTQGTARIKNESKQNLITYFASIGIPVIEGHFGHLFFFTETGKEDIFKCAECDYADLAETACSQNFRIQLGGPLPMQKVSTPGCNTIESLASFLNIKEIQTAKALMFTRLSDGQFIFVVMRGDTQLNMHKLQRIIGEVRPATAEEIAATGAVPGYASAIMIKNALVVVDELIPHSINLAAGANQEGYHWLNTNYGRDYSANVITEIVQAEDGDICTVCEDACFFAEKGEILMDDQGNFQFENILLALAESHHDDKGLAFPKSAAPFDVYLMHVPGKTMDTKSKAEEIYNELQAAGISVLFDDRDERAGVKFNDADLIGCPVRVTVGERGLQNGTVEVKARTAGESQSVLVSDIVSAIKQI